VAFEKKESQSLPDLKEESGSNPVLKKETFSVNQNQFSDDTPLRKE
jgi:hypothetical protein